MNARMVKAARGAMGLSQGELARRAGVSLPTLARFEAGGKVMPNQPRRPSSRLNSGS
jgi:transcriptional regulator with XRE-family HTH domain